MEKNIIGRAFEKDLFSKLYESEKSEFVAVYGRRRVGKTFLIKEYFEQSIVFAASGLANLGLKAQLKIFSMALRKYGDEISESGPLGDWLDAFSRLEKVIESSSQKRKVVLLDELPWMDTAKSGFIPALEHFWNDFASARHDVLLIVCGSATSWMMDKLIQNHGGLHNRLTRHIHLKPFSLRETEQMLESKGFLLSRYEIAVCYMIFGGIPFYLSLLDSRYSLAQNVDRLLFSEDGELSREIENLYAALFKHSADYVKIVKLLAEHKLGLSRTEIQEKSQLKSGGTLTAILDNLVYCGFIKKFSSYNSGKKEQLYCLVDFYTLFYFTFHDEIEKHRAGFWQSLQTKPRFFTWAGHSFERLVLAHVPQVKKKLGISGITSDEYPCRIQATDVSSGSQIDMVIDREDRTFNICEMKFAEAVYAIDATEETKLRMRVANFKAAMRKPRHSAQLTMITTFGILRNKYSGIVNNVILLEDLFDDL